jgi:hypothetical protein
MLDLWQGRFKYGVNFTGVQGHYNVYENGSVTVGFTVGELTSSGTGHWPFNLFKCSVVTGVLASWQIILCGVCFGEHWVHDTGLDGSVIGPDKVQFYCVTSAINHQHQSLGDII